MAHSPRWISLEEYYALGDGTITPEQIRAGVTVAEARSGQVLESKAGPQTLEQKDFQGNAIIHDILTQGGLTETETSDKTTSYGPVNSTITERAPTISKTYQQNQSYSESYQTKTETIHAQTYTRDIQSPQYTKTQNNLNLSVPNNLNVNATQSITRSINTRNATIGTHIMSGQNYNFTGGTIRRFGNITYIKAERVTLQANKFVLYDAADSAPQQVQPRRAPDAYNFYIVNTENVYYHLTNSIDFAEITGNFDLSDFFEDQYWVPDESGYKPLSNSRTKTLAGISAALAAIPELYKSSLKHKLIATLQENSDKIIKPPANGGTLLQANYQVCTGIEQDTEIFLEDIFFVGTGADYRPLIQKAMSGSSVIAAPMNRSCHWEFLFIWVTK